MTEAKKRHVSFGLSNSPHACNTLDVLHSCHVPLPSHPRARLAFPRCVSRDCLPGERSYAPHPKATGAFFECMSANDSAVAESGRGLVPRPATRPLEDPSPIGSRPTAHGTVQSSPMFFVRALGTKCAIGGSVLPPPCAASPRAGPRRWSGHCDLGYPSSLLRQLL